VPIPRAKPRLADATPSSVLSRTNEMRAEAKARAKAVAEALAAEAAKEGKEGKEERVAMVEKDTEKGGKDPKGGKGEKQKEEKESEEEEKGVVAQGPFSASPKPPKAPVGEWWENSPYIKKVGDECILFIFV
jgi:hypothetical protein